MATTPDPSTLTSSTQIFSTNRTLPQIRAIHKSLHVAIDDKSSRLRSQVGGSYRELLGTADAIVQMRSDMDAVQGTLGRMGARCGRGVVGSKVSGLGKFVRGCSAADQRTAMIARARLLEGCALSVERVLRAQGGSGLNIGDRLLVAAKVWVLSRLLFKSLEDGIHEVAASVDASRKSLGSLRHKLMRSIDKVLERIDTSAAAAASRQDVLKALCAYSLATNSGAKDVLWYFLKVRAGAMSLAFEIEESERERKSADVLHSLELYTRTLLDVQSLVPNKLTDALAALKQDALLADESLREMEGLRLDILERWCGEDIQYFKPYIRHDDLDGKQAKEMLTNWASKGGDELLRGLDKTLERLFEFKAIVDLRTNVLQLWIREGSKARGFDASAMLDKLRAAINRHMLQVLHGKVDKLRLVGAEVSAALESWQDGIAVRDEGIWDEGTFDIDLAHGAAQLAQDVSARYHGRNDAVSKAITSYNSWHRVIGDVGGVVEQLRRQRWDNDVDEIEDEDTLEQRQQVLSRDDPQTLHDHLDEALEKAIAGLDAQLAEQWNKYSDSPNSGAIGMYFVRVLRDIREKLPEVQSVRDFGLGIVPSLHSRIAASVAMVPVEQFASSSALTRRLVVGRRLWEGVPELPASPSPGTFKLLRDLSLAMGGAGMDLWSPAAVRTLKEHLVEKLVVEWEEALKGYLERPSTMSSEVTKTGENINGDGNEKDVKKTEDIEDENEKDADAAQEPAQATTKGDSPTTPGQSNKDLLIQWLFDILMLQSYLSPSSGSKTSELGSLADKLYGRTELDDAARQRLTTTAQDYWKRTSLLFGLLA